MTHASILADDPRQQPEPTHRSWYTPGPSDGLGDRLLMFDNTTASSLELLRFRQEFGDAAGFEAALQERVERLRGFSHPSIVKARAVEWLGDGEGLALISNHTAGRRLSEVLHEARGPTFAMALLRQLSPALVALHREGDGIAHGALTPDRVVVTPEGRLVLVEHVLGSALDSLNLPANRLRSDLGIVVPRGADSMALDGRTDVVQLAFVALSLLLGRRLDPADYPDKIEELLELVAASPHGSATSPRLRAWLKQALRLEGGTFESALDAHSALELALEIHRPSVAAGKFAGSRTRAHDSNSADEGAQRAGELLQRSEPVLRRGATLFEFRPSEALQVAGEAAALPRPQDPDVVLEDKPADRRVRVSRRVTIGLAAVAVAEAVFIAGLIYGRPAARSAPGVASPPAPVVSESQKPGVAGAVAAPTTSTADTPALTAASAGRLEIMSDPPGARVAVDGTRRGVTPLAIAVGAGPHTVAVSDGNTTTVRTVNVGAGATATVIAALAPPSSSAGWLSIAVPLDLQILEGGNLLGTSATRIMLPAGRHELDLTNTAVGFQTKLTVEIPPGKAVTASVTIPNGSLSLNALPWANVWLDGRSIGTTPVANLEVPLGTHEIIWWHPQFGERRQTVVVTAKSPVRLVMDLSK